MSVSVLDPSAIISSLAKLLPVTSKELPTQQDGIAALLHAAMAAVGFRLIAVDETSPANTNLVNVLPPRWNRHSPSQFTFRYSHDQSSLQYIVKVAKLGSRTLINAIATESEKAAALDISTNDFTSQSFYPHSPSAPNAPPLVHGFISSNRVSDLLSQIKTQIIQKLIPGLNKEGYQEEVPVVQASSSTAPRNYRPPPDVTPPQPPSQPPERLPFYPSNPLEIGRRDLDPIPRNPFNPPSLFPGNDQDGAPPGARFDPVGPLGPFPGRGNPLGGGRGSAGGHNRPDNDEFMPPGALTASDMPSSPTRSAMVSPTSPRSPISPGRRKQSIPSGFIAPPRQQRPIHEMTVRELQDLYHRNANILSSPDASSSRYSERIASEQAFIQERLVELEGVEVINTGLRRTQIKGEDDMAIDSPTEPPTSRTIEAKRKALSRFGSSTVTPSIVGSMSMEEAINLERQAHMQDLERQQRIREKKQKYGMPGSGEYLTREEREARIWAFMNYKPTDSDLEDEEDEEDDDPSTWFEDDQDDGRKGQDLVEPDLEDMSNIIRVDEARALHYNTFYEPRDEGD
ncbi:hypothetical protein ONZ45_g34 [Pleurotus djamor]|nr:hypothetical protein ONZ45_g34 [Pleurotus djamor]